MNFSLRRIENDELERSVRDYWQEDRCWKWEEFAHPLPASWLIKLIGVVLDLTGEGHDWVGWLKPSSRRFIVKSAYLTLQKEEMKETWKGWRKIWRLEAQERTKVFMWLFAHDRILSNWMRWRIQLHLLAMFDVAWRRRMRCMRYEIAKTVWRYGYSLYHLPFVVTSSCNQSKVGRSNITQG